MSHDTKTNQTMNHGARGFKSTFCAHMDRLASKDGLWRRVKFALSKTFIPQSKGKHPVLISAATDNAWRLNGNREDECHIIVAEYLRQREALERGIIAGSPYRLHWWHTPNGAHLSRSSRGLMTLMGRAPGVVDFIFSTPVVTADRTVTHWGAALELKREKGDDSDVSEGQRVFLDNMKRHGRKTGVAFGHLEAIKWIETHYPRPGAKRSASTTL